MMKPGILLAGLATIMLLLALPAAASDFTLGVFGNANEDDTINMQDVTYTELIILEYRDQTELSDAKYDGKINMQDVTQIELVILGKEKEITVLDSADKIVTLNQPLERIIVGSGNQAEGVMVLKAVDTVVGVGSWITTQGTAYPELSELPPVGGFGAGHNEPDIEAIFELDPDLYLIYATHAPELDEKLEEVGIPILCLDFYRPMGLREDTAKLGYILNRRDEAEAYINFCDECMNQILETTESISEENKPRVYYEYTDYLTSSDDETIALAGGRNIAADLTGGSSEWSGIVTVDAEWVIEQDPEIFLKWAPYGAGYDTDDSSDIKAARDAVLSRTELAHVSAIGDEAVYMNTFSLFGTYYYVSVAYMAKWFHPELFYDLDPQAMHQEYLTEFLGIDYDLSEHGVFVYPPLED